MKELNKDVLVKMIKEQIDEMCGVGPSMMKHDHGDHEGSMARQQMYKTMQYAQEIYDNVPDDAELPAWVQSKLTKIADYVGSVKHYLEYKAEHGMHYESLQEQDEMETAGGAVTVSVDTKQLAQQIYQTIPEEARNEQTMDKLFTDLRALSTDQPAAGEAPEEKGQSMLDKFSDASKRALDAVAPAS